MQDSVPITFPLAPVVPAVAERLEVRPPNREATERDRVRRRHHELTRLMGRDMLAALASTLSHEISQPLSAVLAYTQAALRRLPQDPAAEEIRVYLEKAAVQAKRAGDLARSMRPHRCCPNMPARPALDVNRVVRDIVALTRADFRDRKTDVDLDLAPGLPRAEASRRDLELVLFTLVQLLLGSMPRAARSRRLRLVTRRSGASIEVSLAGTAIEAVLACRTAEGACADPDSTTVGLGMCRSILRKNGGDLVWDLAASGITFIAALPVRTKESADD
jgi:C4-dicarboxylate-specific signal transduction histidine kinase